MLEVIESGELMSTSGEIGVSGSFFLKWNILFRLALTCDPESAVPAKLEEEPDPVESPDLPRCGKERTAMCSCPLA